MQIQTPLYTCACRLLVLLRWFYLERNVDRQHDCGCLDEDAMFTETFAGHSQLKGATCVRVCQCLEEIFFKFIDVLSALSIFRNDSIFPSSALQ